MGATAAFFLHLVLGVACASVALAACRTPESARRFARGFQLWCLLLALAALSGVAIVSLLPASPLADTSRGLLRIVGYLGWLVVGTAVVAGLLAALGRVRDRSADAGAIATAAFTRSPALSAGLAIYVASAFFGFEIGKAAHDAEMRQFFVGSGYPVWFMYAVMAAEIAGALALLARRARFIAACWLGAVMIGAIATHVRNGDPFSDSLDAVRMLILVVCIATLELTHRSAASRK